MGRRVSVCRWAVHLFYLLEESSTTESRLGTDSCVSSFLLWQSLSDQGLLHRAIRTDTQTFEETHRNSDADSSRKQLLLLGPNVVYGARRAPAEYMAHLDGRRSNNETILLEGSLASQG